MSWYQYQYWHSRNFSIIGSIGIGNQEKLLILPILKHGQYGTVLVYSALCGSIETLLLIILIFTRNILDFNYNFHIYMDVNIAAFYWVTYIGQKVYDYTGFYHIFLDLSVKYLNFWLTFCWIIICHEVDCECFCYCSLASIVSVYKPVWR